MKRQMKECKFCGEDITKAIKANGEKDGFYVFRVTCTSCGAEGPISMEKSEAIRRWNMAHIKGFIPNK